MPKFKRVSADEAHAAAREKRKDLVRDSSGGATIMKAARAPASWNDAQRSARFVMTTEQVDRYGDIVVTSGGDVTEFLRNPVGLLFHNARTWPVARWGNIEVLGRTRPPRMEGDFMVLPAGGPVKEVDECAWMIANGGIAACSIGFDPDWDDVELILDDEEDWITGFKFNAWELLECSVCAIPANAGALAKSAHGDVNLAKDLLEDVLDNWVKTPEGLLLSRTDFEATHKGLSSARSIHIVDKALLVEAKEFLPRDQAEIKAQTDAEAAEFIGAKVVLDPAHSENKDWPYDILAKAHGEVVNSFIVDNGPNKGIHGLWVEYLEDNYSGMFRGIKAERFLLVQPAPTAENDIPPNKDDQSEKDFDAAVLDFAARVRGGDTIVHVDLGDDDQCHVFAIHRDGNVVDKFEISPSVTFQQACSARALFERAAAAPKKDKTLSFGIEVNTDQISEASKSIDVLNEKVEQTEKRVDKLFARIRKFFVGGDAEPPVKVDPPPAVELDLPSPSPDHIARAKERAAAMRQRLTEKGLIAAE